MTTVIHSNGRHREGATLTTLDELFERLQQHPLDRTFEGFGNFVLVPENARGDLTAPEGALRFWGNFLTYSHVFSVTTDDAGLIARLSAAIRANQQREDYLDQPPYFDGRKLELIEHRFSATQGEMALVYGGETLGRFGDTYTIQGNGQWRGLGAIYWRDAARKILADRHAARRAKDKAAQHPPAAQALINDVAAILEETDSATLDAWEREQYAKQQGSAL